MEISGRVQVLESGDLLISNTRESDAGLYTCVRANEAGVVTGEAFLTVMGECLDFALDVVEWNFFNSNSNLTFFFFYFSPHPDHPASSRYHCSSGSHSSVTVQSVQ